MPNGKNFQTPSAGKLSFSRRSPFPGPRGPRALGSRCGPACFPLAGPRAAEGVPEDTQHHEQGARPPTPPPATPHLPILIFAQTLNSEKRTGKKKGPLGLSPAPSCHTPAPPGGRLRPPASQCPPAGEGQATPAARQPGVKTKRALDCLSRPVPLNEVTSLLAENAEDAHSGRACPTRPAGHTPASPPAPLHPASSTRHPRSTPRPGSSFS